MTSGLTNTTPIKDNLSIKYQQLLTRLKQITLNLPQLTFEELKQKYHRFWVVEKVYFPGGETQAQAHTISLKK
jgi:hypothetical protein